MEAYPPEYRRQMVELVKSGRTPSELAREYEPSEGSILKRAAAWFARESDAIPGRDSGS